MGIDNNMTQCYNIWVLKGDYMKEKSLIQKMIALFEHINNNKKFQAFRKNLGVKVASLSLAAMMFVAGLTSCEQIDWGKDSSDTREPGIITPDTKDTMGNAGTNANTPDGPDTIPDESDVTTNPVDSGTKAPDTVTIDPSQNPSKPSTDTVTADSTTGNGGSTQPVSPVTDFEPYFKSILKSKNGVEDLMKKYYDSYGVAKTSRLTNMTIETVQPTNNASLTVVLKGSINSGEILNFVTINGDFADARKAYNDIINKNPNTTNMKEFTDAVLKAVASAKTPNITTAQPVSVDQNDINKTLNLSKDSKSFVYITSLKATKVDGQYEYKIFVETYDSVLGIPTRKDVSLRFNSTVSKATLRQAVQDYFAGTFVTQNSGLTK